MLAIRKFVQISDGLVLLFGRIAGLFFILNALIIIVDVVTRRAGYQIPGLGSTRLQELEWHFHTVLFAFLLAATYVRNAHVRVDIATGNLRDTTRAWFELVGCLLLAVPFLIVVLLYGYDFVLRSIVQNEGSVSPQGLPARYIIKTIFVVGFLLLFISVISAIAKSLLVIMGERPVDGGAAYGTSQEGSKQ